eukprot:scaffold55148_cov49-Cyclotella_meneghiniana.AAC.9
MAHPPTMITRAESSPEVSCPPHSTISRWNYINGTGSRRLRVTLGDANDCAIQVCNRRQQSP